ncbi:DUF1294 domain-containing protein [Crassaminicella indica]|uniref:DUF1294 domain-containing protein n=2 Tax=Crassaminicella indica TaxID=2855394 RepID=A0ABX8RG74_9CLOT|nr:DUF1294 domain-containing protein [Crassaminicella indica]
MTVENLCKLPVFYFLLYLGLINLYGLIITAVDKYKAKKEKWRIRERTFFIIAIIGGAAGVMMGMTMFRHKTQHKIFYIGIPILYVCNIIFILLLIYFIYVK